VASDLFEERLALAKQYGAQEIWKVTDQAAAKEKNQKGTLKEIVERMTSGRGLDGAVIAVPSDSVVQEAQLLVRGGGQVLLFSHTKRGDAAEIDLASVCVDEKDLIGSYSADFLLQKEVARLVFGRSLDVRKLVTHQFPLEKTAEAIEVAATPSANSLKVIVVQEEDRESRGT
jgi:L-iditol 2-dehydrogenase